MQKAQEFLIKTIKDSHDSQDTVEEKSGVSKSTISRMMSGQTVSASSMRTIAAAYNVLDEYLGLISASADPKRAADELHEMYRHAEQLLVDNCEERIKFMKQRIEALERSHEKELAMLVASHEKEITAIENANEKVIAAHSEAAKGWHKRANVFTLLFGLSITICLCMVILLAYYIHYDLTHLDMGMFRGLTYDTGGEINNVFVTTAHLYSTRTHVLMSSLYQYIG